MKCPYCIKICSKCKRILVANAMNFYKDKNCKYGLQSVCKICISKHNSQNWKMNKKLKNKNNPFDNIDINKIWNHCPFCIKVCTKCGEILVANETNFRKIKSGKYGLRAECRNCEKEYNNEYMQNNDEKYKQIKKNSNKKYYKKNKEEILKKQKNHREECIEEMKEKEKQYREKHKEKIAECKKQYYKKHKEEISDYHRQWRRNNPHIKFNNHNKRRQREKNQGNGISKDQWLEMMDFFEWKCAYSGEYIGGDSEFRTIDHIIPLSKGGEHEIWNCIPCYGIYNYSKYNKDMLEWYTQQEFYSEERLNKIYEWIEYTKNKYQNS